MGVHNPLPTGQVLEMFGDAMAKYEGASKEVLDDGAHLFVRSVLPRVEEVKLKDGVRGGAALKYGGGEAWVYPYVYRLVCKNGALMCHVVGERHITTLVEGSAGSALVELEEAVRTCCEGEVFETSVEQMRALDGVHMDSVLRLMPFLQQARQFGRDSFAREIMARLFEGKERTAFGLMNAITSLARDERDPEMRWELEKLGGGIASGEWRVALEEPRGEGVRRGEPELVG